MELIFAKINIIRSSKSVTHTLIFSIKLYHIGVSLMAQMVKNLPVMWENWVQSLGWEDLLEKGMATDSSILTWRIPWTEESESEVTQSCLTLCDPMDCSLPGSSIHGTKLMEVMEFQQTYVKS